MAGIGGSNVPTLPLTAQVGEIFEANTLIINGSTDPNDTENVTLTTLFITPSCADSTSNVCISPNLDPGVFKVLSATGDGVLNPCAGVTFDVGMPDPTTGEVALVPQTTVTLGPATGPLIDRTCRVNILLRVFKVPTNPAPGPPTTTDFLTRAVLHGVSSNLNGTASGSANITIIRGEVVMATLASTNSTTVVPGTAVTDTVAVDKAPGAVPPTGNVRFILCQPNEVTAAGCPSPTGTVVPTDKTLVGNTATSDPTNDTTAIGKYCWRARYLGDANYLPKNHTNDTTECFTTVQQPATLATQSNPTGGGVAPGTSVSDTFTASAGVGLPTPTGTVTFFLCQPADVTAAGCPLGGDQVGAAKALDAAGQATSDSTGNTTTAGTYCWRAEYSGDSVYTAGPHTNATNECFTVEVNVVEVCKTPGFYGTHPLVTQAGIDALVTKIGGPLTICGQDISNINVPDPASAIEAICAKPSTDQNLPLKGGRNLMVTAINCVANNPTPGPGATACEGTSVNDLFEACNTECATVATNGGKQVIVTINNVQIDCNVSLDCYNNGLGYDPATNQCTDNQACLHELSVVGTCSTSGTLCSDNVDCPAGETCEPGSASPDSCQEAKGNNCTIFSGAC
jgi:hypothetical protein